MSDVTDILNVSSHSALEQPKVVKTVRKPDGMAREVFSLLQSQPTRNSMEQQASRYPPMVPKNMLKEKRNISVNKWKLNEFANSARKDDLKLKHWVKSNSIVEGKSSDYPFARFNVQCNTIECTELVENSIGKNEQLKALLHLCKKYDLRWVVIQDRYHSLAKSKSWDEKTMEELKKMYFDAAHQLMVQENEPSFQAIRKFIPLEYRFDDEYEKNRKEQLELMFKRSIAEEKEIERIEAELRILDKKLKNADAPSKRSDKPKTLKQAQTIPVVGRGVYLMSATQKNPTKRSNALGDRMLAKVKSILDELKIPERPLPTIAVCNAFNALRQDIVRILSLAKFVAKKESELSTIRNTPKIHPPSEVSVRTPPFNSISSLPHSVDENAGIKRKAGFPTPEATKKPKVE